MVAGDLLDAEMRLWHCADVDFKTLSVTFLGLQFDDLGMEGDRYTLTDVVVGEQLCSLWELLEGFRKDWVWKVRFFVLRERSNRILPMFKPCVQDFLEMGERPGQYEFWSGPKDRDRAARPPRPRPPAGGRPGGRLPAARGRRLALADGALVDALGGDGPAEGDSGTEAGSAAGGSAGGSSDSSSSEASYIDESESDSHSEPNTEGGSGDGGSGCVTPPADPAGGDDFGAGAGEPVAPRLGDAEPPLPPPAGAPDQLPGELGAGYGGPGVAVAPPPAADFEPAPKRSRKAAAGVVSVPIEGGRIVYYSSNKQFMAQCCIQDHVRCSLTRSSQAGKQGGSGRPLGLLSAWLTSPHLHLQTRLGQVWERPPFDERVLSRTILMTMDGSDDLFEAERRPHVDEGEEPPYVH